MPNVELTAMCMIRDRESNRVVVQDRVKSWKGINFPGGHVEDGESIIDAAISKLIHGVVSYFQKLKRVRCFG